jgi:hypothetical protein
MTAEELIIGHYEKTLTSEQEARLASLVSSSPDVRTLYEQHGNIEALMVEEAESITTSSKLDKVVVGAALGTLVEIAGHGAAGLSILGKVASVVGALVVAGSGIVLYNSLTGHEEPPVKKPAATVRHEGVPSQSAPTQSVEATPVEPQPAATTATSSTSTTATSTAPTSASSRPSAARSASPDAATAPRRDAARPARSRPIDINTENPDATVELKTRVGR